MKIRKGRSRNSKGKNRISYSKGLIIKITIVIVIMDAFHFESKINLLIYFLYVIHK